MARRYSDPDVVQTAGTERGRLGGTIEDLTERTWADAELELAKLARASRVTCLHNDPMDAAAVFIHTLRHELVDLYAAVFGVYGLTKEQVEQMAEERNPFAIKVRQLAHFQEFEMARRIGRTEKRAFEAAAEDSQADRKLILQAHKPEKYVPPTRTAVQMEVTDTTKLYRGINPETDV